MKKQISILITLMLFVPNILVAENQQDDFKLIEYHEDKHLDKTTQDALKQFANAADTILVIATHPQDKGLAIKRLAQMLADITKFVVETTRKVCLVKRTTEIEDEQLQDDAQEDINKDIEQYIQRTITLASSSTDNEENKNQDLTQAYAELAKSLRKAVKTITTLHAAAF